MKKCALFYDEDCYLCPKLTDLDLYAESPCFTCEKNKGCLNCDALQPNESDFVCMFGLEVKL